MSRILFLLAGGALGSLSRYWVSGYVQKLFNSFFPWGTLTVNALGSLIIGLAWGLFEVRNIGPHTRMFLFIGFLGGFTTFSSYALESMNLIREGNLKLAIWNIFSNNTLALMMVFAGYFISKGIINGMKTV